MTLFRAVAFICFVIGAILAVVFGDIKDPIFWVCAGLAAFALAGVSFDRSVT